MVWSSSLLVAWLAGCGGDTPTTDEEALTPTEAEEPTKAEAPMQAGPDGAPVDPDAAEAPETFSGHPWKLPADLGSIPERFDCERNGRSHGCFTHLPGGTFLQGAQATDADAPGYDPHAQAPEAPPRKVTVSGFWMQANEVHAGAYNVCLEEGACALDDVLTTKGVATVGSPDTEQLPAVGVSWKGASDYCAWIGARLPTEAEWEFAARGVEGRRFPWGDDPRCPYVRDDEGHAAAPAPSDDVIKTCTPAIEVLKAAMSEADYQQLTEPIGARIPPEELVGMCTTWVANSADAKTIETELRARLGKTAEPDDLPRCALDGPQAIDDLRQPTPAEIMGLAGNVWEWTADLWVEQRPSGPVTDPTGPTEGDLRVQKGGSYVDDDPFALRSAARLGAPADARWPDVGFRCVWTGSVDAE